MMGWQRSLPFRFIGIAGIVLGLLFSGVGSPELALAAESGELPKTAIRLSFKIKGEFAPLYVAVEKGFYREEGVEVEVLEGSGANTVLQTLATGREQFGYLGAPEMAVAVDRGLPVIMVANFVKRMPMVVMAKASTPLNSPKDLEGKKIPVHPDDSFSKFLPVFAEINGVDLNRVEQVGMEVRLWNQALLSGQVDMISGYATNQLPVLLKATNGQISVLNVWEHGVDFLAHGLVVHRDLLKSDPDLVRKVVAGTIKGFEYSLEHPEEAAAIIQKYFPGVLEPDITLLQVQAILPLLRSSSGALELGYNPPEDWERTLTLLEATDQITNRQGHHMYYTNDILAQIR